MTTIQKIDLAAESPRFKSALAKEKQLAEHLAKIDSRIAAIQENLRALSHNVDNRAEAMLSAEDLDAVPGGATELHDELTRLDGDRWTTLRAIDLARKETSSARGEASTEVCREMLPEYKRRVGALAAALLAAYEAHAAVDALTNELDRAGVQWSGRFRPMVIKFFREIGYSDALPSWIREARLHRLTTAEFPEGWVREWNKPPRVEDPLDHSGDGMSIVRFFKRR